MRPGIINPNGLPPGARANHEELRRLRAGLFNDLLRGRRVLGVPAQAQRRMDLDGPTEAHGGEIELAFCQPAMSSAAPPLLPSIPDSPRSWRGPICGPKNS